VAPAPRRVTSVGWSIVYGPMIEVEHTGGVITRFGHCRTAIVRPGDEVVEGEGIGTVGSSGLATGPHVHFEVLVNSRFVDPMSIQVPRERKLVGKDLQDFQKERARIDELMRRAPVMTANK
jgi:murein DD-endopeptidase MepM/ murein hydrolase activator NlpD